MPYNFASRRRLPLEPPGAGPILNLIYSTENLPVLGHAWSHLRHAPECLLLLHPTTSPLALPTSHHQSHHTTSKICSPVERHSRIYTGILFQSTNSQIKSRRALHAVRMMPGWSTAATQPPAPHPTITPNLSYYPQSKSTSSHRWHSSWSLITSSRCETLTHPQTLHTYRSRPARVSDNPPPANLMPDTPDMARPRPPS